MTIPSEAAMEALGRSLGQSAPDGLVLFLSGPLAAGKTTLTRGFMRALGHTGAVKSPTFTLVETYELDGRTVNHFDLYRIADPEELEYIGLDEYFDGTAVCIVEWPERGGDALPQPDVVLSLSVVAEGRHVMAEAGTVRGRDILTKISV